MNSEKSDKKFSLRNTLYQMCEKAPAKYRLTPAEFQVLVTMLSLADLKSGEVTMSITTLTKKTTLSRNTVKNAKKKLEKCGLITTVRKGTNLKNRAGLYRVKLLKPTKEFV